MMVCCQRSAKYGSHYRFRHLLLLAAVSAALLAGSIVMAAEQDETIGWLGPNRIVKARAALETLKADYPNVREYRQGNLVGRLYGATFCNGASAQASAEQFRLQHAAVFGVDAADLAPGQLNKPTRLTQPVMYDEATGEYKFTLVYYHQVSDGVPVYGSELRLLVRNEPGYPLVLASSTLRDLGESFAVDKSFSGRGSSFAVQMVQADEPTLSEFSELKTVVWAGRNDDHEQPRTAVEFIGSSEFGEKFIYIVDPATGDILYKENGLIDVDVAGTVQGKATQGQASEQCEEELAEPLPYARVNIGGSVDYSDSLGEFTITNFSSSDVVVESRLWGEWFRVFNWAGNDIVLYDTVTPPGPASFMHNEANNIEYIRSQINAYYQANRERDFVTKFNPSYPTMNNPEFPIYVNRTDIYCPGNAWYDQVEVSMNFCQSGDGHPNTAWSSVLHHEFGHHLVEVAGSGQDQYGEGIGDCMSILLADDPRLGLGFYGSCFTSLRNAVNTMQYPCTGEAHDCAGLLSGAVWDTRNALAADYPDTYIDILANLVINSILLHTGSSTTPQITIDFLTLDDDDANLDNGTPHWSQICEGFSAHNLNCPELAPIWFEYPNGRPTSVLPDVETTFRVIVHANAVEPIQATGKLYYSIDGDAYQSATVTEVFPNEYDVTLPDLDCDHTISWYVASDAVNFGTITDPKDAPSNVYSAIVATDISVAIDDNFETNLGWTVGGSVADGPWTRGVPVGGGDRGDPASDYDGSGSCWLTDNVDDNSDVDDGTTILYSPILDLSDADDAEISYARWYSNHTGSDPNNDVMEVYVSNNNGGSWTLVETVGPVNQANGGWYTHSFLLSDFVEPTANVKVRFDASDLNSGSVVEAAVDAFKVTRFACNSTSLQIITQELPDWTVDMPYSAQIQTINGSGEVTYSDKNGDLSGTGLSLSAAGVLSGTPTVTGTIEFVVEVVDESMQVDERPLSLDIHSPVVVQSISLPAWTQNFAYVQTQIVSTGGTGTHVWSDFDGGLTGSGLSLSASGLLTGTPTASGTYTFIAQAVDLAGSYDQKELSVTINPTVAITTSTVPDVRVNEVMNLHLEATGGTGTHTWIDSNNDLSGTGLALNSEGLLYGIGSSEMTITFTASVSDQIGASASQEFSFDVTTSCCVGDRIGNVDNSPDDAVSLGDLTEMINILFITLDPPVCAAEADIDQSGYPDPDNGDISLGDLTSLIDYMFISLGDLPPCP